jgi:hypothetical protein
MLQTIKDKISTQIYFNQQLLTYDHSDSSSSSEEEINQDHPQNNTDLIIHPKTNSLPSNATTLS